jgi:CheY-like chemotaxis protein
LLRTLDVLIVEDVDAMRELLKLLVDGTLTPDGKIQLRVTGVARNGPEARHEILSRRPDLILLDEVLPGESTTDLMVDLNSQKLPVLLVTGIENATHPILPGALGRVFKPSWDQLDADRERITRVIQEVCS